MNKLFNKIIDSIKGDKNIKQQTMLIVVSTFLIASLIGFYLGRYYEQESTRRNFQQRKMISPQQRLFNGDKPIQRPDTQK